MKCKFGHTFYSIYNSLQRGHGCSDCAQNTKLNYKEVKDFFNEQGYKLISNCYVNSGTFLQVICPKGHSWDTSYNNFQGGIRCFTCSYEKRKETCLERYGVDNPVKNRDIALKCIGSQTKTTVRFHWKTSEELICQGGYEPKVVDYLNANQINFNWQPQTFKMPSGKTYRPDTYLPDQGVWVEIKGYFRKDAQEKWDWFKTEYPTAELWNKEKLKEMGVL